MGHFFQLVQSCGFRFCEPANADPAQSGNMTFRAKNLGEIAGQGTDIGPFATLHFQHRHIGRWTVQQAQRINADGTRVQLEILSIPGEVIGSLAIHLDGGIGRRHLLDITEKLSQHGFNR